MTGLRQSIKLFLNGEAAVDITPPMNEFDWEDLVIETGEKLIVETITCSLKAKKQLTTKLPRNAPLFGSGQIV